MSPAVKFSGPNFASHDPSTGEIIWQGASATAQDIDAVINRARKAFNTWAFLSLEARIVILERFAMILQDKSSHLAETISLETGKTLWDAKGEVSAMINKIGISIKAYGQRCPEVRIEQPHALSHTRHKPHGVVAVFGPFNFPGHLPNGHIVPALLAGNTVIFKPSELAPRVAEETYSYWKEAGLPESVLTIVQGGSATGQALAHHPDINGLFFTGSYRVGQLLLEHFSRQPEKILALEMGGNNPLVIGQITDYRTAAYLTIQSAFVSSGQRCTCARRLIVEAGSHGDTFLQELITLIKEIRVGRYSDTPEPFMGPLIAESHALAVLETQKTLLAKGARSLVTGKQLKKGTGFISPILIDVTAVVDRPDEEVFGPFLQVIRVENFKTAVQEANRTRYGLVAGLFSDSEEQYRQFYASIHAGVINWNAPLTGASSAAPFGGVGRSGNHRPSATYAADYCSYPVASLENPRLKLPSTLPPGLPHAGT